MTFSFATNNLNYAVMCKLVVWFCGLFNVGKFKNQSKHLNLIKCGFVVMSDVILCFCGSFKTFHATVRHDDCI